LAAELGRVVSPRTEDGARMPEGADGLVEDVLQLPGERRRDGYRIERVRHSRAGDALAQELEAAGEAQRRAAQAGEREGLGRCGFLVGAGVAGEDLTLFTSVVRVVDVLGICESA